jgi:hypothetical protein
LDSGAWTVNEVRASQNSPPVPGGDVPLSVYVGKAGIDAGTSPDPTEVPEDGGKPGAKGGPTAGAPPRPENKAGKGTRPPTGPQVRKAVHDASGHDHDEAGRFTGPGASAGWSEEGPHEPDRSRLDRVMGKAEYLEGAATKLLAAAGPAGVRIGQLVKRINGGGLVYGNTDPHELAAVLADVGVEWRGEVVRLAPRGDVHGKSMSSLVGSDGGALVPPATVGVARRKRRVLRNKAAVAFAERVIKGL